jgi:amidohydrolase
VFLGVTPPGQDARTAAPNHSPLFQADEAGLLLGVRVLAHLACDWLEATADHVLRQGGKSEA